MKISLSHVALLVPSAERSAQFLRARGISSNKPEVFESEGTNEVYVGSYDKQSGLLLLIEAISEGPYHRALAKRGPGLHHIALDVLDIHEFSNVAQLAGWQLHPISTETMSHNTAWFFIKGIPTLIEVHQKKEVSEKPLKISMLELPIQEAQLALFKAIGLEGIVSQGARTTMTVDGQKMSFEQIAGLELFQGKNHETKSK